MSGRPELAALVDALAEALRPLVAELVAEELERGQLDAGHASGWLTVEEYAAAKRTTPAAVHKRLERGRIPGAEREGRRWLIPAPRSADTLSENTHMGRAPRERPRPGHREDGPPDPR